MEASLELSLLSLKKEKRMKPAVKPIIIFRHAATEGLGYLGAFLDSQNIPWHLVKVDEGEPLPATMKDYSGMVLMGGPMSVNDDLPWIASVLALIREASALDIPLLGHCLGGQLMSKAFGAQVTQNLIKEIGWGEVAVTENADAKSWFGDIAQFNSFHWHGETFSLPEGATHLLASAHFTPSFYHVNCHFNMTLKR